MSKGESKYLTLRHWLDRCPHLLPCPFCGAALDAHWDKFNPSARCPTVDCMARALPLLCLDDPEAVARWNTRADARGCGLAAAAPVTPGAEAPGRGA